MSKVAYKQIFKLVLINLVIIIVFTFISGEIYLRFIAKNKFITPEELNNQSMHYEPAVFAKHIFPEEEQTTYGDARWHNSVRYINNQGYFGHNFSPIKNKDTVRIIIYGGSAVYDPIFSTDETWPFRIEKLLREKGFPNVEVINAAIPGHTSHDSFGRLFAEGHTFQPDYVILYNTWNDIKMFSNQKTLLRTLKPYVAKDNPFLYYRNTLDQALSENSQLYLMIRENFYKWKLKPGEEGATPKKKMKYQIQQQALDQFKLNIEMFVDLARNINATPILMKQGRLVTPNNMNIRKLSYSNKRLPHFYVYESFMLADNIIESVAKEKGVLLIDASKYLTGKEENFSDHIHLSETGSKLLANVVTEKLAPLIQTKDP